jgi:hypothetical protein
MNKHELFEEWRVLTPEEGASIETRKQASICAAQGTVGTCAKRLWLSIDIHITVAGEPPNDEGMNEPDPVYHARRARLLAAVKSNPAALKQWMDVLVVDQMHQKSWSYWNRLTGGEVARQDLLAPALTALAKDDQAYLAEIAPGASFDDMIELFIASFTITVDVPVIREKGDEA